MIRNIEPWHLYLFIYLFFFLGGGGRPSIFLVEKWIIKGEHYSGGNKSIMYEIFEKDTRGPLPNTTSSV